ncbi:MAG TPA: hypothetical protein PK299_11465 [Anaerolineales bacterium]|nr:hypothetical protein [Anaerolineales bacterium]
MDSNGINLPTGTFGRYLYSVPIAIFGLLHFLGSGQMAGMVPSWLPGGVLWVYLTGIALIAAAVAILIGKMGRLACQLLGILLIIFALTVHLPNMLSGADPMALGQVLKDLALAGGAWVLSGVLKS